VLSNNTATDTDNLTPAADLAITKTDGVTTAVPGNNLTTPSSLPTTARARSTGLQSPTPSRLRSQRFVDVYSFGWLCLRRGHRRRQPGHDGQPAAGRHGDYTVTGTVSASATGTLVNTAAVVAPSGVTDSTPATTRRPIPTH